MATIIQQPDILSLSGNIKPFILSSGSAVNFKLEHAGATIFETSYEPGTNITVDIRQLIEDKLFYKLSSEPFYEQNNLTASFIARIDNVPVEFRAVRAGVANFADTPANFLTLNFLTWQPQSKAVTYNSPEWLTAYAVTACTLKLKAYLADGATKTLTLGSLVAGKAYTANLQYALIAGLLGQIYPTHFEVWTENSAGARLSFIQRYSYSNPLSELEQWFLFENSLGGMDTVRCYGDTDFEAEHDHKLSVTSGQTAEHQINTRRNFSKNTGYLSDYERRWLLDFFPSRKKRMFALGALRDIVVVDSSVKYTSSDLPSSFTFKYRFTSNDPFLNLIRNESNIPDDITIPDINSPDFFLPPRLAEYPRIPLSEGVILPAFNPLANEMGIVSVGTILGSLIDEVLQKIPGAGSGGQLLNLLKEKDVQGATDNNVFSGLRALLEITKKITANNEALKEVFLSRQTDDTAYGLIRFLRGLEIGNYTQGALGGGGAFKMNNGISELEVDKLTVRMAATFYELIISKIQHIGGQLILTPTQMKCTKVVDGGTYYRCYFDTGGGEVVNEFVVGDQARCQVFSGSGMKFYWRLVTSVGEDYINLSKTDKLGDSIPEAGDDIVQLGNRTNPERQNAQILSTVGSDAPSDKQYAGINSFSLEGKELNVTSSKGNAFSGIVKFSSGSSGLNNIQEFVDLNNQANDTKSKLENLKIGGVNLLRNSAVFAMSPNTPGAGTSTKMTDEVDVYYRAVPDAGKSISLFGLLYTIPNGMQCMQGIYVRQNSGNPITVLVYRLGATTNGAKSHLVESGAWTYIRTNAITGNGAQGHLILSCPTANASIDYKKGKLEEGNSGTAWSENPDDIQARIDAEKQRINEILNDNIADPSEKQYLLLKWNDILSEFDKLKAQAASYSVSVTAFQTAYNELKTILDTLFVSLTTNSNVDGTTMRAKFANYYNQRTILINAVQVAIEKKANAYTDAVEISAVNLIAKKYIRDWNLTNSNITQEGSDADGNYLAVNQQTLYNTVGGGASYNDIFQQKIKYKENAQYCFKIRWKLATAMSTAGLMLRFKYSDGTYGSYLDLGATQTTIVEAAMISVAGKTVSGIACLYGTASSRSLIYDIQLTEGNKQVAGYIVSEADTDAKIDSIEVGGVNLIKNGNFLSGLNNWNIDYDIGIDTEPTTKMLSGSALPENAVSGIEITTKADFQGIWQNFYNGDVKLKLDRQYTLTFLARATTAGKTLLYGHSDGENTVVLTTAWQGYKLTFTPTAHRNFVFYLFTAGVFQITNIQLEQGNKPTPFKNDPFVEKAIEGVSGINGGLMYTALMLLRNELGIPTAGLSGLNDNILLFSGQYQDALNSLSNILLRKDGSGQLAGGGLWWNKLGQLFFGKYYDSKTIEISPDSVLPTLAEINNKENYQVVPFERVVTKDFNDPSQIGTVSDLFINNIQEFTLKNDGFLMSNANIKYWWGTGLGNFKVSSLIVLEKQIGNDWTEIDRSESWTEANEHNDALSINRYALNRGNYRIRIFATCSGENTTGSDGRAGVEVTSTATYQLNVKKLIIASDGIAFHDSMSDNYFRLSLQDSTPLRYWGAMDIPAGLGGGSVGSNTGGGNLWGRITNVSRAGSTVTISHSIGDAKYMPQVALNGSSSWYFQNRTANSIQIVCSGAFDFILVRTPY